VKPAPVLSEGARLLRAVRGTGPDRMRLETMATELRCSEAFVRKLLAGDCPPGLDTAVRAEEIWDIPPRAWTQRAHEGTAPPVRIESSTEQREAGKVSA
jgi:hypothetical protein